MQSGNCPLRLRSRAYFRQQERRIIDKRVRQARTFGVVNDQLGRYAKASPLAKGISRPRRHLFKGRHRMPIRDRKAFSSPSEGCHE